MVRTIVSIEEDDKTWLDLKAAEEKSSRDFSPDRFDFVEVPYRI